MKRKPKRGYRVPSLKKLVSQITRDNRYNEIPDGPPRGKEKVKW